MSATSPSLGTATSTDYETHMELAIEVKVAAWMKEQVAAEIVRPFAAFQRNPPPYHY
jgi:hypothetical protein